jgi:L-ascorbate metabolism protein UlaG (beta-lactamase superfamily)
VKTRNHFLVFDYFWDELPPDQPGLCNGHIDPAELTGEKVTVFASHEHADHFDARIFGWRDRLPGATYVLGFQTDTLPAHQYVPPHETRVIDGMKVTTIKANDAGVGFLVEVDGLVLFHAGDHANRQRDLSGDYPPEIQFLKSRGVRPDIAFLPSSGCSFGDPVAVLAGVHLALEQLQPALFLPMHAGSYGCRFGDGIGACRQSYPQVRTEMVRDRGDHLRYRKGSTGPGKT